jgi:hypothetical protein
MEDRLTRKNKPHNKEQATFYKHDALKLK